MVVLHQYHGDNDLPHIMKDAPCHAYSVNGKQACFFQEDHRYEAYKGSCQTVYDGKGIPK